MKDLVALLALDRSAEALALCTDADDADALDARARALRQLGRDAEAEQAMQRLVTLTGARSEGRLRTVSR